MSLKKKRERASKGHIVEINVVPYVDVMLVLMVIFMITAPMLTQGVTVDLPKAISKSLKTSSREPIVVSVDKAGSYFLNIHAKPNTSIPPHDLMVRVAAELTLARETGEPAHVLVKGDQGVAYGKVVEAMALLKQAGAENVGLVTDSTGMMASGDKTA
ncbi:MAG: protein TolR [Legionellaceae bacterium]|nr:protein TolR [Legionellaceae bacterium]